MHEAGYTIPGNGALDMLWQAFNDAVNLRIAPVFLPFHP